jgi:hypothetical protein
MQRVLECSFLIPIRRDANLGDGGEHDPEFWNWLDGELFERFEGVTYAPLLYYGSYVDPATGERVSDESFKFTVAIEEARIEELRKLLTAACVLFQQKCIYLSVAGQVEFVQARSHEQA